MSAVSKQVIGLLTEMDPAERAKVIAAARALDASVVVRFKPPLVKDWLIAGIELELQRRGLTYPPLTAKSGGPSPALKDIAPDYEEESALIRGDLEARLHKAVGAIHYAQLVSLGATVARALAAKLEAYRPVGVKAMLTSVVLIPEAIEDSFPGYLAAGMISMLLRQG